MKIYSSISELVGNTPLLEVSGFGKENGCRARILCKLEGKNPAGSAARGLFFSDGFVFFQKFRKGC